MLLQKLNNKITTTDSMVNELSDVKRDILEKDRKVLSQSLIRINSTAKNLLKNVYNLRKSVLCNSLELQ